MNWENKFAHRTALMKRSTVREILKQAARPGMISFAGGLPAPELFPIKETAEAAQRVLEKYAGKALQYGETEGVTELRDYIARQFSRGGLKVQRDNVLITTGGQQALDLIGRALIDEGDIALVENPTYLALLLSWRPLGTQFIPLASDQNGLVIEEVEQNLARKPKLLYLVPNFQNPQGTTLSLERRQRLIKAIQKSETLLIEDDPYGQLRYEGDFPPSLLELGGSADDGKVVNVGTFSKVLAPGFRVGWVIAPRELLDKLVLSKQAMDLHTSTFNQFLIWELIESGVLEKQLPILRKNYRERRDLMLQEIEEHFPEGVHWTKPEGGMFLLVTLPAGCSARELAMKAMERNVLFVPGDDFHLTGGENTFRLNFSNATPDKIREGVRRLATLLADQLQKNPPEKIPAGALA
jgi:2-aminoadipate transaminase